MRVLANKCSVLETCLVCVVLCHPTCSVLIWTPPDTLRYGIGPSWCDSSGHTWRKQRTSNVFFVLLFVFPVCFFNLSVGAVLCVECTDGNTTYCCRWNVYAAKRYETASSPTDWMGSTAVRGTSCSNVLELLSLRPK